MVHTHLTPEICTNNASPALSSARNNFDIVGYRAGWAIHCFTFDSDSAASNG